MFYVIGLGLCDEKDITVRGLEAIKSSSRVYLEAYTSILMVDKSRLEAFYGKPVILADRDMVETQSDEILTDADKEDVSFLVVGDPFGATTHTDLLLRARSLSIPIRVIHNASILNAVGATGLALYSFGQAVSLVFFTETWKPDSFYDRIKENVQMGLHTLVLLDIKVKEQSEENLARGRKIFEPPRYMSVPQAISQLLEIEEIRKENVLNPDSTLVISLSRAGGFPEASSPSDTNQNSGEQRIHAGTLSSLSSLPPSSFGDPLHSLVIVGRRLHAMEVEYASAFAADPVKWKEVAIQAYGVSGLD